MELLTGELFVLVELIRTKRSIYSLSCEHPNPDCRNLTVKSSHDAWRLTPGFSYRPLPVPDTNNTSVEVMSTLNVDIYLFLPNKRYLFLSVLWHRLICEWNATGGVCRLYFGYHCSDGSHLAPDVRAKPTVHSKPKNIPQIEARWEYTHVWERLNTSEIKWCFTEIRLGLFLLITLWNKIPVFTV